MMIAVSDKGGVSKKTLTATLSKLLANEGRKVIALDADKIMPLSKRLSLILAWCALPTKNFERLYIELKELIKKRTGITSDEYGKFFKLNSTVDI